MLLRLCQAATLGSDTNDSCVFVDFTAETSEFDELNAALDLVKSASVFGSVLDKFDPLVLSKIPLDSFKYSILGQDLKITPTISSINITGLSTVVPKSINVTSANTVDTSADSEEQVSVDASLKVSTNLFGASATAQVKFHDRETDIYGERRSEYVRVCTRRLN
ncbi:unnamed protein product [Phytophthora lilii]|uniref:Unnamed protein product n=1 Tax=Phytophthora lilii TaxID=2077276 RepID=A0A9W6YL47_9STRA|nr:unnamed protein product [Phytophthora lilii]